ncbi:MAG TPA: AMP-binding protein [Chryseolinea sp.]|nr:AMP-binding protein [Chryseolinea sp.]
MSPIEQFINWERKQPSAIFLRQPFDGQWKTWTYSQAGNEVRRIAARLSECKLPPQSKVAILSKNCAHWIMADLAIMMCGFVSVPIYATLTAPSIKQILEHSESKAVFIGKLDHRDTYHEAIPPGVIKIGISTYGISEENNWEDWLTSKPFTGCYMWKPEEILTIIYTSGTTGKSKGVMHSEESFYKVVSVAVTELGIPLRPKLFSYLPLSHIAERSGIEMIGLYTGAQFSFAETLDTFAKNLADTQPNIFFAVPRIWSKFREKILEKLPQAKLDRLLSIPLVSTLIKKSIRKKLGLAKASHIYTGAAPISVEVLQWFEKLGIIIFQAYGMTEDCLYAHFNRHGANRLGTVGQRLSGLQVKLAAEGEIRLKGPGNLKGYYKEPELTASSFDEQGFLKTGDIGEIDADGFLKITGRLKDQFKTDKGKYISPAPIEMRLLTNELIELTCVVGMGIPQPIALVVLSPSGKTKSKEEIIRGLTATLAEVNPILEPFERIEKAIILKGDWTIENGLLTPSLKVKRNEVEKIHLPKYPQWYKQSGVVIWEHPS